MDGGRPGTRPEEDADPAVAAFSGLQGEVAEVVAALGGLRAEVSGLGRRLERLDGVVRQGGAGTPGAGAPDYSPTLGAMAQELSGIGARLAAVEGKPALALTPAGFEAELERVVRGAAAAAGTELRDATRGARTTAGDLEELVGRVRARREQRQWVGVAGLIGAMAGVLLWIVAAGALPRGAGHWLAALLVGGSRWEAGAALMRTADLETWGRMTRLYNACPRDSSTELCEAAMAVRTIPPIVPAQPAQPGPEGAKAAQPVRPAAPPASGKAQR